MPTPDARDHPSMRTVMRTLLGRLIPRELKSAQDIVDDLNRKGVPRDKLNGKHLAPIYRQLNRLSSAPDFASIREALPGNPASMTGSGPPILGVIVETRKHPALDYVVSAFQDTLQIPVQLFHGKLNRDFIMSSSISQRVRMGSVHLVQLEVEDLDARKYNALLLTRRFWEHLISRCKILVFQTDTILCSGSDYALKDFTSFDYIGSKWPRARPVGLLIDGGNGGLSIRDWNKSHECLVRFPPDPWPGGEDGYFAFHIDLIGGNVGRDDDCARFSTQHEFLYKSFGAHRISGLDPNTKAAFLRYCEDAKFMRDT